MRTALEGVPSIWCKFLSGTGDPTSMGDQLGVVRSPYLTPATPHAPKPAYLAARVLHEHLRGAEFRGRVSANFGKAPAAELAPGGWRGPGMAVGGTDPPADPQPDGISIMGYSGLPTATVGSALYVLEFAHGTPSSSDAPSPGNSSVSYSVWSVAGPTTLVFEAQEGCYSIVDMLGSPRPGSFCTDGVGVLRVENVTDAPLIAAHV